MIYRISNNVNFVKGYINGAIYDFNTGKVYSVNDIACKTILKYCNNGNLIESSDYLKLLANNNLISPNYKPSIWEPSCIFDMSLEMAWIEITQKCNLKCIHCYEGNDHTGFKDVLSLDEWKNVINQLAEMKINRLIVIGGEPCCNKDVNEILKYASNYPIDITLFTNATMIDECLFETIIENKIRVKISVYGPNEMVHDGITTINGSFAKLVKNVKRLKENNIDVTASIVLMKENEDYIDETIAFVKSIGMNFKKYDVIRNVYGGTQTLHTPVTKKALDYAYFKKPNFKTSLEQFEKNFQTNTCWYGKVAIMENGDVIPCEFERNFVYGNIRCQSLSEVLNGEKTKDKWFLNFDKIQTCKDCEYRYACKDCRALGLSVCGTMTSKNPRCLYNPYTGKWEDNDEKTNIN